MEYYIGIIDDVEDSENGYLIALTEKTQYNNGGTISTEVDDEAWNAFTELDFEEFDDDSPICLWEAPPGMTPNEAISELEDAGFIFNEDFSDDADDLFNEGYEEEIE